MSLHTAPIWVEIPTKVHAERIPAEAPDFSELSPCPGHPAYNEINRVEMPEIPREGKAVEAWLDKNSQNWLAAVDEAIDKELSK